MIRIESPNPAFSGVRYSFTFVDGTATAESITDAEKAYFEGKGYTVKLPAKPKPKPRRKKAE